MIKRMTDLSLALVGVLLASPLIAVTALLVRVKLGSPVIFRQKRPGLNGEPFCVYKFRTMTQERGADGELLPDDRRLTRFGKTLRSLSLDELPQLFNVIAGDLSLVGPRPLLMEYLPCYTKEQARRHEVRPGITGWAQVNGRNALTWDEKFRLDVWYVDNRSLLLDAKIILMTVMKVLMREGISERGNVTMTKFSDVCKNKHGGDGN